MHSLFAAAIHSGPTTPYRKIELMIHKTLAVLLLSLAFSVNAYSQDKRYHGDGIDDVLRFVPLTAALTMKAAGVESASSWKRLAVNSALSVAISSGATWGLKHAVDRRRPDGTDCRSFPSGHTTIAFAGATILYKEYSHVSKWIGVAGFGVAALTAADRVRRNRHHWEDVAAGAAIGVGGTMLGYCIGDLLTKEKSRYAVSIGGDGVTLCVKL